MLEYGLPVKVQVKSKNSRLRLTGAANLVCLMFPIGNNRGLRLFYVGNLTWPHIPAVFIGFHKQKIENKTKRGKFMKSRKHNVVICPPCGDSVAVATKEGQNKENTFWPLLPRLTAVLPPQGREMNDGFTLIELLVVVLIIGILAAIALPQYNKAVAKARMTEAVNIIKALQNGIDIYLLEHGIPSDEVTFLGEDQDDSQLLDITVGPFDCSEKESAPMQSCVLNHFWYSAFCTSEGCGISVMDYPTYNVLYSRYKTHGDIWRNSECMGTAWICDYWNSLW